MKASKVLLALLIGSAVILILSADFAPLAAELEPPLRLLLHVKNADGSQTWYQGEPIAQIGGHITYFGTTNLAMPSLSTQFSFHRVSM